MESDLSVALPCELWVIILSLLPFDSFKNMRLVSHNFLDMSHGTRACNIVVPSDVTYGVWKRWHQKENVKCITFNGCALSLIKVDKFPFLEEVVFSNCAALKPVSVFQLSLSSQLRKVQLMNCGNITDNAIASLSDLEHLTTLRLVHCCGLTDDLGSKFPPFKGLQKLDVTDCGFTDQFVHNIAKAAPPLLSILILDDNLVFDNDGIVKLADLLPNLQQCSTYGCDANFCIYNGEVVVSGPKDVNRQWWESLF